MENGQIFYIEEVLTGKKHLQQNQQIIEGQIIYDLSSLPNTQSVDTNIITNSSETFKGEVNPEWIDNIIDETRGFNSKQEIKRYIIDNYGRKSYNIFADYMNSFRNYETAINEIEANNFGNEIKEKLKGVDYERHYAETMGYAQKVRKEWNVRTGYENGSTINKEKNPTSRERGQAGMDKGTLSRLQRELTDELKGVEYERLYARNLGYSEEIRTIGQIRARHGGISTESQKGIGSVDTRGKEKTEFATDRELTDAQRGIADDSSLDKNVYDTDKVPKKEERIENERLFSETMGFNEEIRTVRNVRTGYRDGFEKPQGNVEKLDERR